MRILPGLGVLASIWVGAGCQPVVTQFEIVSFRSSAVPEIYRERFDGGYYRINADHNWTLVFEIKPVLVRPVHKDEATSQPASAPAQGDDEELWMSQIVEVEVFWRPHPGRSYAESSQTNANIVYCLTTGTGSITYEGAGFVTFSESRDRKSVKGRIESATLYPARTVKEPSDLFGPCRMTGTFTAVEDRKRVVERLQEIRRRFGPPVVGAGTP